MFKLTLLVLLIVLTTIESQTFHIGVDVSYGESFNSSQMSVWECISKEPEPYYHPSWASLRAWDSQNQYNDYLTYLISYAGDYNIYEIHLSVLFCPNSTNNNPANDAVTLLFDELYLSSIKNYKRIWIVVENSENCWLDPQTNCGYITEVLNSIEEQNPNNSTIGFYSSKNEWHKVFSDQCNNFANLPLWYKDIDDNPHFSDKSAYTFGGWRTPFAHQWMYDDSCGVIVGFDNYITM